MDKFFKDNWLERLEARVKDMSITDLLRIQRTVDKLDLTDFFNITGVARSTVCKIENGKRTMSQLVYQTIVSYLEGNFDEKIKIYKANK
ncbi:helix-turn-helix domain-containing protein [Priestia megaterium]|uniref:helix-turn-helix domain-containing protein n=1 Tax=Priestia megaterium TaxID=1404 RepID=UPI002FFEA23A